MEWASARLRRSAALCLFGIVTLASLTFLCIRLHLNIATIGFLYLIVVVLLSLTGDFVSSAVLSIISVGCLAYFFAPPIFSFRVVDPLNVVTIIAFLTTSLVVSRLVSKLHKMSEEALSSVNRKLIDAEERERSRIARDLHDDIGQRLALLLVTLERARTSLRNPTGEVLTTMDELREQALDISGDIQALSHELHARKLEYLGLVATARSFCREFGAQHKVEIDFKSHDLSGPLPFHVVLSLFRVLQEALHNSARHSGSRHFEVELFGASQAIHLTVHDSGLGFDPQAAKMGRGLGLTSMQERLKLVRGEFSIDSQPRNGTTIHARVPLSLESGSAAFPTRFLRKSAQIRRRFKRKTMNYWASG